MKAAGILCQWVLAITQYIMASVTSDGDHLKLFTARQAVVQAAIQQFRTNQQVCHGTQSIANANLYQLAAAEVELAAVRRVYEHSLTEQTRMDQQYTDAKQRLHRASTVACVNAAYRVIIVSLHGTLRQFEQRWNAQLEMLLQGSGSLLSAQIQN